MTACEEFIRKNKKLPTEKVTGSLTAPHLCLRRTKCCKCFDYIQKSDLRITHVAVVSDWVDGRFQNVLKKQHAHATCGA